MRRELCARERERDKTEGAKRGNDESAYPRGTSSPKPYMATTRLPAGRVTRPPRTRPSRLDRRR